MPQLKSFLKDYEAQEYEGVEVEFKSGYKAIMTIYKNGLEVENITLSDYSTKEEMHKLMKEKGFKKMRPRQIEDMKARLRAQAKVDDRRKREKRSNQARAAELAKYKTKRKNQRQGELRKIAKEAGEKKRKRRKMQAQQGIQAAAHSIFSSGF
eukprot:CAMPEP_0118696926 /NCGR_PEP_ID=MMETSP0800-20121206/14165_1 /TAXON_ID=210618 ORGANISM="Striatella unipunctata, Strain CCMP2910" /NCGR_SAMPLE_ID=MMETSP0800 /ASSEMBLY_ACC=CAM_ASM_000638 /LENGTH=152 /DNA_ID=CAMNT_0006596187 /DNA_START=84 /DNA_END=542 /DNA_ORIENTATION=+